MSQTLPALMRGLIVEIHHDVARWTPGVEKSLDFKRDRRFLLSCDGGILTEDFPRMGKYLDSVLALGQEPSFSFEGCETRTPARIFRYWVEGVRRCEVASIRALRQVLHLFAKFPIPRPDLEEQAIASFVERNESVGSFSPDEKITRIMRAILEVWMEGWDLSDIRPKHGPGAVADGEKPWEKFHFKNVYRKADTLYPADAYYFLNLDHFLDEYSKWEPIYRDEPTTRLCCVPKDFRGPRLIAAEPLEIQWLQQGQARYMMDRIETSRYTRGLIRFRSQDHNRNLACRASLDGRFATLDLKDASDRVSYSLVSRVVPRHVFQYLDATRSEFTRLPTGDRVKLNMMSTMGSAVCFPIESIVFGAAIVASQLPQKYRNFRLEIERIARGGSAVYGDDLIVPTDKVDTVKAALEGLGFVLNPLKCCTGPHFRESCGCDAYDGTDITPIRIKSFPDRRNPESLPSATDNINCLAARGLQQSASWLLDQLRSTFRYVGYSTWELPCTLRAGTRVEAIERNSALPCRYNRRLQCYEYRIDYVEPVFHRADVADWSLAFASILYGFKCDSRGFPVPHRNRLKTRWTVL